MKKSPLIEKIARSANIEEQHAKRAINIILSGIVEGLRQNKSVALGDFGVFKLLSNVDSNDQKNIKNSLRFIPSTKLRQAINKPDKS